MPSDLNLNLDRVTAALRSRRMPVDTEARLQAEIGAVLADMGIPVTAEYRLDQRNRIDFFADGIGIEAKIGGGRLSVWRQLERYAAFPSITALVLVGTVAVPSSISTCGGKPFRHVSVGAGWL
ncbi:hypothetical protein [Aureimonas phyllosphaerae]|uniref:Restriction endonuclease n=1 Tax=Aureimonas phyllosphaerae TaxID=1166078 RepID=A0A7W6C1H4_9HYPH|nr:hypothetical protein [Aureimonas phyllosphaerae]MBB3937721.1 hypothetical protein [Aureimonas phyllosphaerae]MBB3961744.1 hypothetical protein [Aureimonas phyllosphaerae]SFF45428.1 hypothetical protein SAMN05216566_11459 [Aureimonas phyllosphaerae]